MSLTIVIVDDQEVGRAALERVVRSAADAPNIVFFKDAVTALAWIVDNAPDLVITDFVMPGAFDGLELLRRLKTNPSTSRIPVIVVTGRDDEETRNAALELQAIDYLSKPIDHVQCKFRIRNVLSINQTARDLQVAFEEMEALRKMSAEHEEAILIQAQIKATMAAKEAKEAKDLFVAMVSHEFRTPLQSIISTVEALSGRLNRLDVPADDLDSLRTPMRRLHHDAEQLMLQASDLADFVRAEAGRSEHKPRRIDLPVFLGDVIAVYEDAAKAKGLTLKASARDVFVVADLMRLRQVTSNLVGNAVKYTLAGEVTVTLDAWACEQSRCQELQLTVSDTGIGIPQDLQSKVFEPWIRGEIVNGQKGMGLGLSIVQKLVTSMKGTITLESEQGVGTTVRVRVPVATEDAAGPAASVAPPMRVSFPYRVLMVDDTDSTRESVRDALEDAGAKVSEASGGPEALSCIRQSAFDVVFLDLQMPGMDGYEVASRIRAMDAGRPRLIVAMSAFELDAVKAKTACGAPLFDAFVAKPVSMVSLVAQISPLLTRQGTRY